jgi:uncharacterized phiE125 gp8 family phage protein
MYAPRPIIARLDNPEPMEILSLDLVKEFIGLDPDIDAEQDAVLPVLLQAAVEQGEQITGIAWGAAKYRIDGLHLEWPGAGLFLPLLPVFEVAEVSGKDGAGTEVPVDAAAYTVIPSAIEYGWPWAKLCPAVVWPAQVVELSVTCTAGWSADKLPHSIRSWLLNRVATLYDMRQDVIDSTRSTVAHNMPRIHSLGLLDRWVVRGTPDA